MSIRCTKPWRSIDAASLATLPGQLGVFEFADAAERVVFIGRADARSLFGLRGEIARCAGELPNARLFRFEVTTAYHTRYLELLMVHAYDFDALPRFNPPLPTLGRLTPG
jgi:hypothetical protein